MTPNWHRAAACANAPDPELWFPVGEGAVAQQQTDDAKAICRTCPVAEQCLSWALETRQDVGIWGGLTERKRRNIHRRRPRHGTGVRADRTPATVLADHSVPTTNGHTIWSGPNTITIQGHVYSPNQLAWHVAHGTAPDGYVSVHCGYPGCVTADHLLDAAGRLILHGTEAAYTAHRRRGEQPCDDCKAAHSGRTTAERSAA
jgi:hypothetical protein